MPFAKGYIKNQNSYPVAVSMKAQFMDRNNIVLDDGIDFIDYLSPGQTARFEMASLTTKDNEISFYNVRIEAVYRK